MAVSVESEHANPVLRIVEKAIYGLRWALAFLFVVAGVGFVKFVAIVALHSLNVHTVPIFGELPEEGHALIDALTTIDGVMVANVLYLIIGGSYAIYVTTKEHTNVKIPQGLQHLTSGLLKEKMASSLMGVSSVYILTQLIQASEHVVSWQQFYVVGGFHLLLILGFLVMNITNRNSNH